MSVATSYGDVERACHHKVRYATRKAALTGLAHLRQYSRYPAYLELYKCRHCRDFHIGNRR